MLINFSNYRSYQRYEFQNPNPRKMKTYVSLASLVILLNMSFSDPTSAQVIGANFVDNTHGNGGPGTVYAGTGVLGESFVPWYGPGEPGDPSTTVLLGQGVSLTLLQNDPNEASHFEYDGGGATDLYANSIVEDPALSDETSGAGYTWTLSGLVKGDAYDVAVYSDSNIGWTVQGVSIGSTTGGSAPAFSSPADYLIDYNVLANSSGDIILDSTAPDPFNYISGISVAAAPEPSTWAMLLGGLGLLAFWRVRTRRVDS